MVSDLAASVAWSDTERLGLELRVQAGDEWAEVAGPDLTIGLHQAGEHGPQPGSSGSTSIGLPVADFDAAPRLLEARGVELVDGPIVDGPIVDGPIVDGPVVDGPIVDGPVVDGPVVDGPVVDGPVRLGFLADPDWTYLCQATP